MGIKKERAVKAVIMVTLMICIGRINIGYGRFKGPQPVVELEREIKEGKATEEQYEGLKKQSLGGKKIKEFFEKRFDSTGEEGEMYNGEIIRTESEWERLAKKYGLGVSGAVIMGMYLLWREKKISWREKILKNEDKGKEIEEFFKKKFEEGKTGGELKSGEKLGRNKELWQKFAEENGFAGIAGIGLILMSMYEAWSKRKEKEERYLRAKENYEDNEIFRLTEGIYEKNKRNGYGGFRNALRRASNDRIRRNWRRSWSLWNEHEFLDMLKRSAYGIKEVFVRNSIKIKDLIREQIEKKEMRKKRKFKEMLKEMTSLFNKEEVKKMVERKEIKERKRKEREISRVKGEELLKLQREIEREKEKIERIKGRVEKRKDKLRFWECKMRIAETMGRWAGKREQARVRIKLLSQKGILKLEEERAERAQKRLKELRKEYEEIRGQERFTEEEKRKEGERERERENFKGLIRYEKILKKIGKISYEQHEIKKKEEELKLKKEELRKEILEIRQSKRNRRYYYSYIGQRMYKLELVKKEIIEKEVREREKEIKEIRENRERIEELKEEERKMREELSSEKAGNLQRINIEKIREIIERAKKEEEKVSKEWEKRQIEEERKRIYKIYEEKIKRYRSPYSSYNRNYRRMTIREANEEIRKVIDEIKEIREKEFKRNKNWIKELGKEIKEREENVKREAKRNKWLFDNDGDKDIDYVTPLDELMGKRKGEKINKEKLKKTWLEYAENYRKMKPQKEELRKKEEKLKQMKEKILGCRNDKKQYERYARMIKRTRNPWLISDYKHYQRSYWYGAIRYDSYKKLIEKLEKEIKPLKEEVEIGEKREREAKEILRKDLKFYKKKLEELRNEMNYKIQSEKQKKEIEISRYYQKELNRMGWRNYWRRINYLHNRRHAMKRIEEKYEKKRLESNKEFSKKIEKIGEEIKIEEKRKKIEEDKRKRMVEELKKKREEIPMKRKILKFLKKMLYVSNKGKSKYFKELQKKTYELLELQAEKKKLEYKEGAEKSEIRREIEELEEKLRKGNEMSYEEYRKGGGWKREFDWKDGKKQLGKGPTYWREQLSKYMGNIGRTNATKVLGGMDYLKKLEGRARAEEENAWRGWESYLRMSPKSWSKASSAMNARLIELKRIENEENGIKAKQEQMLNKEIEKRYEEIYQAQKWLRMKKEERKKSKFTERIVEAELGKAGEEKKIDLKELRRERKEVKEKIGEKLKTKWEEYIRPIEDPFNYSGKIERILEMHRRRNQRKVEQERREREHERLARLHKTLAIANQYRKANVALRKGDVKSYVATRYAIAGATGNEGQKKEIVMQTQAVAARFGVKEKPVWVEREFKILSDEEVERLNRELDSANNSTGNVSGLISNGLQDNKRQRGRNGQGLTTAEIRAQIRETNRKMAERLERERKAKEMAKQAIAEAQKALEEHKRQIVRQQVLEIGYEFEEEVPVSMGTINKDGEYELIWSNGSQSSLRKNIEKIKVFLKAIPAGMGEGANFVLYNMVGTIFEWMIKAIKNTVGRINVDGRLNWLGRSMQEFDDLIDEIQKINEEVVEELKEAHVYSEELTKRKNELSYLMGELLPVFIEIGIKLPQLIAKGPKALRSIKSLLKDIPQRLKAWKGKVKNITQDVIKAGKVIVKRVRTFGWNVKYKNHKYPEWASNPKLLGKTINEGEYYGLKEGDELLFDAPELIKEGLITKARYGVEELEYLIDQGVKHDIWKKAPKTQRPGDIIYVVTQDAKGNTKMTLTLRRGDDYMPHPMLSKGDEVVCAGEVRPKMKNGIIERTADGKIMLELNNKSGHFSPHKKYKPWEKAVEILENKGYDIKAPEGEMFPK